MPNLESLGRIHVAPNDLEAYISFVASGTIFEYEFAQASGDRIIIEPSAIVNAADGLAQIPRMFACASETDAISLAEEITNALRKP